jgi:ligand-binding sensor domain-containing protein
MCLLCLACVFGDHCRAAIPATDKDAPTYLIDHWTTADGLPVNGINQVVPSQSGYLWLATFDGLVRFDGHQFTVLSVGPETPGLPGNRIVDLIETHDGQLWLRTEGDYLARFDGKTFHILGQADGLPDAQVERIQIDSYGTLWAETSAGLAKLVGENRFAVLKGSRHLGYLRSLLVTAPGTLWVTTDAGAFEFQDDHLQRHLGPGDGIPVPTQSIVRDRSGRLWIASQQHVMHENEAGRFKAIVDLPDIWRLDAAGDRVAIYTALGEYTVAENGTLAQR